MSQQIYQALRRGANAEAAALARQALADGHKDIQTLSAAALAFRAIGERETALSTIDAAIAQMPDDAELHFLRAHVEQALEVAGIYDRSAYSHDSTLPTYRVLEPSCGDGRIMDELRKRGCQSFGIEYHAGRAAEARAKGHNVLTANFLECPPRPEFDFVVMNPPFSGRHYIKHISHALKFLKPGGRLVSILPATAWYDHGEIKGSWTDLPVGSFAEAGTNVPTGIVRIGAPA